MSLQVLLVSLDFPSMAFQVHVYLTLNSIRYHFRVHTDFICFHLTSMQLRFTCVSFGVPLISASNHFRQRQLRVWVQTLAQQILHITSKQSMKNIKMCVCCRRKVCQEMSGNVARNCGGCPDCYIRSPKIGNLETSSEGP